MRRSVLPLPCDHLIDRARDSKEKEKVARNRIVDRLYLGQNEELEIR